MRIYGDDRASGAVTSRRPKSNASSISGDKPIDGGELASSALLDYAGAATYLGTSTAFLRRVVLEKRMRYYKIGKFVRFRVEDLEAFIEDGRVEPLDLREHGSVRRQRPWRRRA